MTEQDLLRRIQAERSAPPQGFAARQQNLLLGLQRKEGTIMKKKTSVALALAIAFLLLITAAAVAEISGFSLLGFLQSNNALTPETKQLITPATDAVGAIPGLAEASVQETLFDGHSCMATIRLMPQSGIFLIPDGWEDMNMEALIPGAGDAYPVDYARERGLKPYCVVVNSLFDLPGAEPEYNAVSQARIGPDGDLTLICRANCETDADSLDCQWTVRLIPYTWNSSFDSMAAYYAHLYAETAKEGKGSFRSPLGYDWDGESSCVLRAALSCGNLKWRARLKEPVAFPACGVTVTDMTVKGYALSTHVTIACQVTDMEAYQASDDGLWFEVLDESGGSLRSPLTGDGNGTFSDDGGVFHQQESLAALESMPSALCIRAYNCWFGEMIDGDWQGNSYGTQTAELSPQ